MNGIPLTEELKATLNQFYVYAYIRQRNSLIGNVGTPYYIGKGKDDRAWEKHKKTPVPKDISRIIIIDHNLTEEEAFILEVKMIAGYGRVDNKTGILRNLTDGGEGTSGVIHTEETRRKLSIANKGKTRSEETRRKMSESQKGKIPSDETRRKLSESKQNISEETRRKFRESNKNPSEETRRKISIANKGKTRSEETRRKMSELAKSRTYSEETRRKMSESAKNRRKSVASGSDIYAFLDGKE